MIHHYNKILLTITIKAPLLGRGVWGEDGHPGPVEMEADDFYRDDNRVPIQAGYTCPERSRRVEGQQPRNQTQNNNSNNSSNSNNSIHSINRMNLYTERSDALSLPFLSLPKCRSVGGEVNSSINAKSTGATSCASFHQ